MSADPAILLDVSRLISRLGMGPATGIDRVEAEWLGHLDQGGSPYLLLARVRRAQLLLPSEAGRIILGWLDGRLDGLPPAALIDRLRGRQDARLRAEVALRRMALKTADPSGRGLAGAARAILGEGATYLSTGHSNLSDGLLSNLAPLPRVMMIHDTIPLDHPEYTRAGQSEKFAQRFGAVLRHADLLLAISQATRADVIRWRERMGLPARADIAVVPIGTRLVGASALPDVPQVARPFFVTLGTIEPRKNHALLLDAWKIIGDRLPPQDVPGLVIIGRRGWENHATFARLDACPEAGPIVELSGLDDGAVAALVGQAQALLMPSRAEGFGLPYTEAAARGVPVICAPLVAAREVLGDYACYLSPDRPDLWAEEIMRRAAGPALRQTPLAVPQWDAHFALVDRLMREGLRARAATAMPS